MTSDGEQPKYDIVIALGKNWEKGNKKLSLESRMTALAAGKLLADGVAKRAIFSGGYTAGDKMPSEARGMGLHMFRRSKYKGQAANADLEEASLDTSRNAENVKKGLKGDEKVLLLSMRYHFPRARRIFKSYGIKADIMYSDRVLKGESPHMDRFLRNYFWSPRHLYEKLKEKLILNPISWIDRKGKMLRSLATFLRGRKKKAE
jgi:uncharacterized SAM-binding protein YcdF (DUF218 family)